MKAQVAEYSLNTFISVLIAIIVFLPFYLAFGNTWAIWSAILVVGMPHFILGALGYLAGNTKKVMGQFLAAAFLGILLAIVYYRLPAQIAPAFFLGYFLWHLLINEQMFENTIKAGYAKWQNAWPVIISWGSIVFVLIALAIAAFYHLGVEASGVLLGLWVMLFLFLAALIYGLLKERRNGNNSPLGFLVIFGVILVPAILTFGRFAKVEAFAPTILLALYHFMAWYVFYTKRLAKFPKSFQEVGIRKILFGWRKNARSFWQFVIALQLIWIGLLVLYLRTPASGAVSYLVAPYWVPFWTIIHVTTSFLPAKPVTLPSFSNVFANFRLRFS